MAWVQFLVLLCVCTSIVCPRSWMHFCFGSCIITFRFCLAAQSWSRQCNVLFLVPTAHRTEQGPGASADRCSETRVMCSSNSSRDHNAAHGLLFCKFGLKLCTESLVLIWVSVVIFIFWLYLVLISETEWGLASPASHVKCESVSTKECELIAFQRTTHSTKDFSSVSFFENHRAPNEGLQQHRLFVYTIVLTQWWS